MLVTYFSNLLLTETYVSPIFHIVNNVASNVLVLSLKTAISSIL